MQKVPPAPSSKTFIKGFYSRAGMVALFFLSKFFRKGCGKTSFFQKRVFPQILFPLFCSHLAAESKDGGKEDEGDIGEDDEKGFYKIGKGIGNAV